MLQFLDIPSGHLFVKFILGIHSIAIYIGVSVIAGWHSSEFYAQSSNQSNLQLPVHGTCTYHYKGHRNTKQIVWTTKGLYLNKNELGIHLAVRVSHGVQRVLVQLECSQSLSILILDPLTPRNRNRQQVVSDTFKNHPGRV